MPATVAFVGTKAKQKTAVFQRVAHTLENRHAALNCALLRKFIWVAINSRKAVGRTERPRRQRSTGHLRNTKVAPASPSSETSKAASRFCKKWVVSTEV